MKPFERLKSGFGYLWAASCLLLVLATFVGLGFWARTLANGTGIKVSPRFTGGEVRRTVDHGGYQTLLHRPVFDGLLSERAAGFVQIDWVPGKNQSLPPVIEEDFDIDGDGAAQIRVRLDTVAGKAELLRQAPWVVGADQVITVDSEQILRIRLRNPRK